MSTTSGPLPLAVASPASLRRELVGLVVGELLGPAGGEEEILASRQRPRDRYLAGVVAPTGVELEPERDETLMSGDDDIEDSGEGSEVATRSYLPSSIGLTFHVAPGTPALVICAGWGRYERVTNPDGEGRVWQRAPVVGEVTLPLRESAERTLLVPVADYPEVRLQAHVRKAGSDLAVTVFLRNDQQEPERNRDTAWLFQAEIEVRATDGSAVFVAGDRPPSADAPLEARQLALAYRRRREFAAGHGIAVGADVSVDDPNLATAVRTQVVPQREVPQTGAPDNEPLLDGLERDMETLGNAADEVLAAALDPLVAGYRTWIERQHDRVVEGADGLDAHTETAQQVLADAEKSMARIADGIDLLRNDPDACEAFRFANRVMAQQRVHSLWAEHRRRGGTDLLSAFDIPKNRRWRPFQLAFLLLSLPAIADPAHPDRSESPDARCDLLWFPTGGGKTEAYLGLAAFTMAMRRMQGPLGGLRADAGVAVLMRYTLRVLTLQQFQRAAALMCACETIRRDDPAKWGEEPFRIGLWVGQATTPNTVEQAHEAIRNQHGDGYVRTGGGRPDQLAACPWCGSPLVAGRDIRVETYEKGRARVLTYCSDPTGECAFTPKQSPREGIPVMTVDEEIYRRLPAMLIATVDKFAQLPWNGATQALFGKVDGRCERHGFRASGLQDADSHPQKGSLPRARTVDRGVMLRPPDLIIQDELHLISGPLGTLVGLYETAVDRLCSWDLDGATVRPKVVASTATIRQAREQVHALFLREVAVFPPQGLDAEDSFFSRERASTDEDYGRLYIGVCAPGRRLKVALIRTYFAFLAAGQRLFEKYGQHADPWMSLVGYFGSIRELAGMRRACEDDIRTRLLRADDHGLAPRRISPGTIEELTSRLSAADIPRLLDQMERGFGATPKDGTTAPRPLDVLLATNMISVGVDIRRLGLMVTAGQPKTTAEYIQATSRVGRATPGVVCTVFNWARPRDLSHYTQFEHYHDCFYRHVEPLSVTPFAKRSLDRGLSALLAALIRLSDTGTSVNGAAQDLDPNSDLVRDVIAAITARAGGVDASQATVAEVREMLQARLDAWRAHADRLLAQGSRLGYQPAKDSITPEGLLKNPGTAPWDIFTTLNSLRDVEPSAGLVLRDGSCWIGMDEGGS